MWIFEWSNGEYECLVLVSIYILRGSKICMLGEIKVIKIPLRFERHLWWSPPEIDYINREWHILARRIIHILQGTKIYFLGEMKVIETPLRFERCLWWSPGYRLHQSWMTYFSEKNFMFQNDEYDRIIPIGISKFGISKQHNFFEIVYFS